MPLRQRLVPLTTPQEVDSFIESNPRCAIFKAGMCHKTAETFRHVDAHLDPLADVPVALIRVIEHRAASNRVVERTGIRHESPQILLFRDGTAVFESNNWDISDEAMAEGMARFALEPRPA